MKHILFFCLLCPLFLVGQNAELDSLLSILPTLEKGEKKITTLSEIGELYARSDLKKSVTYFSKALQLSQEIASPQSEGTAHKNIGVVYIMSSNLDSSRHHYNLADGIFKKLIQKEKGKEKAKAYEGYFANKSNIGNWFYYNTQMDSAILYHQQVIDELEKYEKEEATELDDADALTNVKSTSLNTLGFLYFNKGNFDKAMDTYLMALNTFEKTENLAGQGRIFQEIGNLHATFNKDFPKALIYYRQAFQIKKALKDRRSLAWSEGYLAANFVDLEQYDSANFYLNNSLSVAEELQEPRLLSFIYNTQSRSLLNQQKPLSEIKVVGNKWLEITKKVNNQSGTAEANNMLAAVHFKADDFNKAIQYAERAITICEAVGIRNILKEAKETLYKSYKKTGADPQKTLTVYEECVALKDSIFNEESVIKTASLAAKFETEQKEKEIAILEKNKAVQAAEIESRKSQTLAIALGALGLIALGGFFYFRSETKKKIAESKKQIAENEANRLNELNDLKNRFYTNITHEFRTPLTVIKGMAEQMEGDQESKTLIQRNSKNLLHLVNQLMELSKLESQKMTLHLVQRNIVPYLFYLTESLRSHADSKNIDLSFQAHTEEQMMDFDPEKIQHIIINLLANAIKFTQEGGAVQLNTNTTTNQLIVKVIDNGIGIQPEHLPHVFDRFYQADSSTTRRGEGTGIGLALVRELAELMKGSIAVKSDWSKGTEFTLKLPIQQNAPVSIEMEQDALVATTIATANPIITATKEDHILPDDANRLLIIEDNPDVVTYLKTCLQNDYQIEVAYDGKTGIEKAIETIPDIIISDVMMPEKDGYEVTQTLKNDERTSHIPIIILTAKADDPSRLEGLERGADAYLSKPFHKKELTLRLSKLIELRKKLQARYATFTTIEAAPEKDIQLEDAFLTKVNDIIENHLDEAGFGVNELSQTIGLSQSQLFRKLKALTGKSTNAYLRSYRLHRAKSLLEQGELNVSEAAYEVGFNDPLYFSRVFSKEFGISPKAVGK